MDPTKRGKRLNVEQEKDILNIRYKVPYTSIARNAFIHTALDCPPEVTFARHKNVVQTDLMADIMREFYLPFVHQMYDWLKMYGIYPWKKKRVKGTSLYRPWIPPLESGYIETYMTKRGEQRFRWFNTYSADMNVGRNEHKPDLSMNFGYKSEAQLPSIHGEIRSDLAQLLVDYKTTLIIREATELTVYGQARVQHVLEFHPPKSGGGDDNLTTLTSFSDSITGHVRSREEQFRRKDVRLRTDALKANIKYYGHRQPHTGYLHSESFASKQTREHTGVLENAIPLDPDYHYKPVQAPKIGVNLNEFNKRFDLQIAGVMDFPAQLIEAPSGNRSSNYESQLQYLNTRIKDWVTFFRREIKNVFIQINEADLTEGFNRVTQMRLEQGLETPAFHLHDEIDIFIPCATIATYEQLQRMWKEDAIISKETFAKHTTRLLGIPEEEVLVQEYPDHYPREMYNPAIIKKQEINIKRKEATMKRKIEEPQKEEKEKESEEPKKKKSKKKKKEEKEEEKEEEEEEK